MPCWYVALGLAMPGVVVTWLVTSFAEPLAGEVLTVIRTDDGRVGITAAMVTSLAGLAARLPMTGPFSLNQEGLRRRHASCQNRDSATVEVGAVCSDQRLRLLVRPRLTGLRSRRDELPADDPG